jgi:hypothetical protein
MASSRKVKSSPKKSSGKKSSHSSRLATTLKASPEILKQTKIFAPRKQWNQFHTRESEILKGYGSSPSQKAKTVVFNVSQGLSQAARRLMPKKNNALNVSQITSMGPNLKNTNKKLRRIAQQIAEHGQAETKSSPRFAAWFFGLAIVIASGFVFYEFAPVKYKNLVSFSHLKTGFIDGSAIASGKNLSKTSSKRSVSQTKKSAVERRQVNRGHQKKAAKSKYRTATKRKSKANYLSASPKSSRNQGKRTVKKTSKHHRKRSNRR